MALLSRAWFIFSLAVLLLALAGCGAARPSPPATAPPTAPPSGRAAAATSSPTGAATPAGAASPAAATSSPAGAAIPPSAASPAAATARPGGPAPTGVPVGMGSTAGDGVFPRTVVHFGGTTTAPAEPKRVVVIATGQLDSALTLGIVPIGAAAGEGAAIVPDYIAAAFPQYAAQLEQITPVGARLQPNLEAIALARPDMILANQAGSKKIYPQLSAIAPTILTEGTGVNWQQDFLLIAAGLGRTGSAEQFLNDYYARAERLARAVSPEPPGVSLVRFNPGRTRIFGVASFAGSIVYDAGLDRPPSQRFNATSQDLSPELVAQIDGDWIFYSVQGSIEKTPAVDLIGGDFWAGLSAVKAGRAIQVDDDPWYLNAGPSAAMVVLRDLEKAILGGRQS